MDQTTITNLISMFTQSFNRRGKTSNDYEILEREQSITVITHNLATERLFISMISSMGSVFNAYHDEIQPDISEFEPQQIYAPDFLAYFSNTQEPN